MSAYVRYYRRLQALTQRLSTYLDRLEARAREFGVSSARTAMEMQITDPASVSAFRSEVEAQIMFLHTKAQRVFAKHFAPFLDIDADLFVIFGHRRARYPGRTPPCHSSDAMASRPLTTAAPHGRKVLVEAVAG